MHTRTSLSPVLVLLSLAHLAPAQAGWQRRFTTTTPEARGFAAMVCDELHGQCLLMYGDGNGGMLNNGWLWDGTAWTPLTTPLPPLRSSCRMAWDDGRQRVILFGGSSNTGRMQPTTPPSWSPTALVVRAPPACRCSPTRHRRCRGSATP